MAIKHSLFYTGLILIIVGISGMWFWSHLAYTYIDPYASPEARESAIQANLHDSEIAIILRIFATFILLGILVIIAGILKTINLFNKPTNL